MGNFWANIFGLTKPGQHAHVRGQKAHRARKVKQGTPPEPTAQGKQTELQRMWDECGVRFPREQE